MTATALHPSEITFTCPPWCTFSREEHLAQLGDHEGRVVHSGPDQTDLDRRWYVSLSAISYPDGTLTDGGVMVNVCVEDCDLTPVEARELVEAIVAASAEAQR
jgi:hypothetical protein